MDNFVSEEAIKDYCFEYDNDNKVVGSSMRSTNPKKLVDGIDLKDLFNGKDVVFEVTKGYDEEVLEQEDPDVFNEILYADCKHLREERGAPPPNISFELLASKMINVTENGYVKKQIIIGGSGNVVPEHSIVTVGYNLYKEFCDVPFDSTYLRKKHEKFRLDKEETIIGLHYAVRSMKKNENSRFFIKWEYAFGILGCPDRIEPKCNIIADVTLVDFHEIIPEQNLNALNEDEVYQPGFQSFLNEAKQHHINGCDEFKKGDTLNAIKSYKKELRTLNEMKLSNETEEKATLEQKVKCLVNLALCYNKVGKFEQSCLACQDALSIDYDNVKACFHYGRANLGLSNFSASLKWLKRAAKLKPYDPDINNELQKLNEKKSLYNNIDKDFWEKAFKNIYITKEEKDNK